MTLDIKKITMELIDFMIIMIESDIYYYFDGLLKPLDYGSNDTTNELVTNAFLQLTDKIDLDEKIIRICNSGDICIESLKSFSELLSDTLSEKYEDEKEKIDECYKRVNDICNKLQVIFIYY